MCRPTTHRFRRPSPSRDGQALLEFALIALVLTVMLGATLSLGYMFYAAHTIQQAVDVAAQEIARTPFPAASELGLGRFDSVPDSVMETALFREQIFDEKHLVIDPNDFDDPKEFVPCDEVVDLQQIAAKLPLLNRLLVPAMILDKTYDPDYNDTDPQKQNCFQGVYRFPGAIVTYDDPATSDGTSETVVVPLLDRLDGETVIRWVLPVEEMFEDLQDPSTGPFSLTANIAHVAQRGTVALRINYPFQAAGLVSYVPTGGFSPSDPSVPLVDRVTASDVAVETHANYVSLPGSKYQLAIAADSDSFDAQGNPRTFSGRFGLGRTMSYKPAAGALGVRPYRRVISAQAIYRREVFE